MTNPEEPRRYTAYEMREAYKEGAREQFDPKYAAVRALKLFPDPLPLLEDRSVPDPHDPLMRWKVGIDGFAHPEFATEGTRLRYTMTIWLPTWERVERWRDLMEWPFLCGGVPCKEDRTLKPGNYSLKPGGD